MKESEVPNEPVTYDGMRMENDFRDVANAYQEMYDDINALPTDTDDMLNAIIGMLQRHVSEVWSPPRVTALATQYGRVPGSAYTCLLATDQRPLLAV